MKGAMYAVSGAGLFSCSGAALLVWRVSHCTHSRRILFAALNWSDPPCSRRRLVAGWPGDARRETAVGLAHWLHRSTGPGADGLRYVSGARCERVILLAA